MRENFSLATYINMIAIAEAEYQKHLDKLREQ